MQEKFAIFTDIFLDFHPKTRPVLWRVLITQVHIYEALAHTREMKLSTSGGDITPPLLQPIPRRTRQEDFDWRLESEKEIQENEREALDYPFEAAYVYLLNRLGPTLVFLSSKLQTDYPWYLGHVQGPLVTN